MQEEEEGCCAPLLTLVALIRTQNCGHGNEMKAEEVQGNCCWPKQWRMKKTETGDDATCRPIHYLPA
jgi:hypothetical protein